MDGFLSNYLEEILRWIHYFAGVTWIGLLYFFNFINAHVVKTFDADTKKKVVPELLPRTLWWFRWGAMFTFLSGLLMIAWFMHAIEGYAGSGRFFWILFGGGFGTVMWFNVWFIIWPAQRQIIGWTKAGEAPPEMAAVAKRALYASRTNVFLSIPLLFFMGAAAHVNLVEFALWKALVIVAVGFGIAYHLVFQISGKVGIFKG
jgi:uncharacterized membrane protein